MTAVDRRYPVIQIADRHSSATDTTDGDALHVLTRIVRSGLPRRIAPAEEVLALKPDLKPPD